MAAKFSRCGPVMMARPHGGGLQQIMPAAARQRPAHEDHVGQGKQPGQLADRIQQQDARKRQRGIDLILGAQLVTDARGAQPLLDHFKPFRLARRQDQQQARMRLRQFWKASSTAWSSSTSAASSPRHGAGGDPDASRAAALPVAVANQCAADRLRAARRRTSNCRAPSPFSGAAPSWIYRSRSGSLCDEYRIRPLQNVPKEETPPAISWKSAAGDPAVDNHQARSGAFGLAIQHRPDLGFKNHNHAGPDSPQHAANRECVVDGRIRKFRSARPRSLSSATSRPATVPSIHTAEGSRLARAVPGASPRSRSPHPPKQRATKCRRAASQETKWVPAQPFGKRAANSADRAAQR